MSTATSNYSITEETLCNDVQHIVYDSDLRKITQRTVFQRLQDKYGILLTQFKPFIYERAVETARIRIQSSPELQKQQECVHPKYYYGRKGKCLKNGAIVNYQDVKKHYIGSTNAKSDAVDVEPPLKRRRYNLPHFALDIKTNNQNQTEKKKIKKKRRYRKRQRDENGQIIKKRKKSGLTRLCFMSKDLQDIVGDDRPLARNKITKGFWNYLEHKKLKLPGRIIQTDEKLKKIWGNDVETIHMYSVQKGLKAHITTMSKDLESKYKKENPHLFENDSS
eukprot:456374_1